MNNKVEGPETFGQPNLPVAMAPAFFFVFKDETTWQLSCKTAGEGGQLFNELHLLKPVYCAFNWLIFTQKIFSLFNDTFNDY